MTKISALFICFVAFTATTTARAEGLSLRQAMESATKTDLAPAPVPASVPSTTTVTVSPPSKSHGNEVTIVVTTSDQGKKVGYASVPVAVSPAKQHKSRMKLY